MCACRGRAPMQRARLGCVRTNACALANGCRACAAWPSARGPCREPCRVGVDNAMRIFTMARRQSLLGRAICSVRGPTCLDLHTGHCHVSGACTLRQLVAANGLGATSAACTHATHACISIVSQQHQPALPVRAAGCACKHGARTRAMAHGRCAAMSTRSPVASVLSTHAARTRGGSGRGGGGRQQGERAGWRVTLTPDACMYAHTYMASTAALSTVFPQHIIITGHSSRLPDTGHVIPSRSAALLSGTLKSAETCPTASARASTSPGWPPSGASSRRHARPLAMAHLNMDRGKRVRAARGHRQAPSPPRMLPHNIPRQEKRAP